MDAKRAQSEPQCTSNDERAQLVTDIASQIVNDAWLLPSMSDVKAVADSVLDMEECNDTWCICGDGLYCQCHQCCVILFLLKLNFANKGTIKKSHLHHVMIMSASIF